MKAHLTYLTLTLALGLLFGPQLAWAQPSNDQPCNAIALTAGTSVIFSNTGATVDPGEVNPGPGSGSSSCTAQDGWCSFEPQPPLDNSVWFSFTPAADGFYSIETGGSDLQLAVYSVGSCGSYGTYTELAANDDSNPDFFFAPLIDDLNLTAGVTYYIQVDGYNGATTSNDEILVSELPAPPCLLPDPLASLSLVTDSFGGETTWQITDMSGSVVLSGGPYASNSEFSIPLDLNTGCYEFTIFDSFGDGICCTWGTGSYTLIDQDCNVIASGGAFASSDGPFSFCVENATCDDGIQNGDEEGVDCGGSDCAPCFTCFDGIQNGEELGVDCGGPDCEPCVGVPTCEDGADNGNETGVDCGGPDCEPCFYCNDLIDLFSDDFENGFGIWNDGGSDVTLYNNPDYALSGDITARLRDNSATSVLTSDPLQASPYNKLILEYTYLPRDMEAGEGFYVEFSNDGGQTWTVLNDYRAGVDFTTEERDYQAEVVDGPFSDQVVFRFRNDGNTNTDFIHLDDVHIFACPAAGEATCFDGIQNGDEEDVDCGGTYCEACPTCDDGIQNGDEEGVDCGGPDCAACPTCDDGVQNGDEEGVDCGGSDCEPCATCDDGIQNGDELGVDCGGASCPTCPCVDGTVDENDFEAGFGIWNDGGSDCARYSNGSYASSGSFSIRLRDNSATSNTYTDVLDLGATEDVVLSFTYYARSYEEGEGFELQVSTDGGGSFSTVASYVLGSEFENEEFVEEEVSFAGFLSATTVFRFVNNGNSNTDWVHLDDITIEGCQPVEAILRPAPATDAPAATSSSQLAELSLFPNPTVDNLQVKFFAPADGRVEMIVTDLSGRTVHRQPIDAAAGVNRAEVNTTNFNGGVYFLHLLTKEGRTTERFVVIKQ